MEHLFDSCDSLKTGAGPLGLRTPSGLTVAATQTTAAVVRPAVLGSSRIAMQAEDDR